MQFQVSSLLVKWLLYITLGCFSCPLFALVSVDDYFKEVWTSRQGLPHNSVNSISQTTDGYLWFATWEGVARYNGLSFTIFSRDGATGIVDAGTRTLVTGDSNRLWVGGARGGITLRKGFNWYPQTLAKGLVNHILEDNQRNLWIAIEGEGVFYRPFISDGVYGSEQKVLNFGTYRLAQNQNGLIYAATSQGVFHISNAKAERIVLPGVPQNTRVSYVSFDRAGALLIASHKGAWRLEGETVIRYQNELMTTEITLIEESEDGAIWLGTLDKGLARLSSRGVEFINVENGLPNSRVLSWFQDSEGSIWVGTNRGVLRLRTAPFNSVDSSDGLVGDFVRTVLDTPNGELLVGTSEGLNLVEDGKAKDASLALDLSHQSILSLANSSSGKVYVGTQRSGLFEWQNGKLSALVSAEEGLPSNEIRAILEDSKGRLWLGTVNGVLLITPDGKQHTINQNNSNLPDNYVMAISEDSKGHIWIGTAEGVAFYTKERDIHVVDISVYEDAQYVFGFYVEPGFVWMASDRGIIRYDVELKSIGGIGKPSGLPIDKFFQIVYDHMGSFWLTSNRGIWKISYVEAHRVASGSSAQISFEHFGEMDGMGSDQVNGGSTPAALMTKKGLMVFATAKGVSLISPNSIKQLYQYKLPVVLEQVEVDSQLINPESASNLGPGVNRLRIKFAGLSFIMPERIQYQTRLVGFEEEWSYRENQTVAEYTNLPPGKYEFLVSARYPYGAWSDAGTSYQFEILPFWWQKIEVQVLSVLMLVALLASLVLWRIRLLKLRQVYLAQQIELKTQALREQSELYEKQSKEDPLTGLSNRRAFDEKIRSDFILAFPQLSHLNLAIIDIDHFKQVNDRFSHLVGDEVIKLVASYLNATVLEPNQVARWGGEEFTVLLHCSPEEAKRICKKLLDGVAQIDYPSLEGAFDITVSIGLANGLGCKDYQTLLKRADQALYVAKENGRNRVECFDEFKARG